MSRRRPIFLVSSTGDDLERISPVSSSAGRVSWHGHRLFCMIVPARVGFRPVPYHPPSNGALAMAEYVPSPRDWVREQVGLYESSGGTKGTTLRDTGLPVVIVTHVGNKTGHIRKPPLMRVKHGNNFVLVGSQGGAPTDPAWVHNLRVKPNVEIRDETVVRPMRVREVADEAERSRLWKLAIAAYPPYAEYQERTVRRIPVFIAERT